MDVEIVNVSTQKTAEKTVEEEEQVLGKLLRRTLNLETRNVSKPSPLPVSEYLFEDPTSFVEVPRSV